jgi:hypothetical protein
MRRWRRLRQQGRARGGAEGSAYDLVGAFDGTKDDEEIVAKLKQRAQKVGVPTKPEERSRPRRGSVPRESDH